MTIPYRARPGAGFVVLSLSLLGAISFFAWGLRTPPLDEVWRLQIELGLRGVAPLTGRQFHLLQRTLQRYPAFADSLLEEGDAGVVSANHKGVVDTGYAVLLRKRPDAPGRLQVTGIGDTRVGLTVRTQEGSAAGETDGATAYAWQLPNDGPFPQLVELRLTSKRHGPLLVTLTP